jgi:aryl-alcohol dehydrogenase-like predicted oxidoreductase
MSSAIRQAGPAAAAGTVRIGEGPEVHRLGFGAMRISGPGAWGPPADPKASIDVLRSAVDLGVNLIDTADSYGPGTSEELIREALHPYEGLTVATKAGLLRPSRSGWTPCGRPEYLRQQVELSLRRLDVERIDLFQLHRVDPTVPAADQFGLLAELQAEGKVDQVGLSEVSVDTIEQARGIVEIATVQNRYNLLDRSSDDVLRYCTENGIGFLPWRPVAAGAAGALAEPGGAVAEIAWAHGITAPQVALAWLLQRSSVMLPIPGTGDLTHLEENCRAAEVELSLAEIAQLDEGLSSL